MVDPDLQPLVLDIGSGMSKAGFSGDDAPRTCFPTIVGHPKNRDLGFDTASAHGAQARRGILDLKYPVEHGRTFYNELRVTPEEHPVMFSEPPLVPRESRERKVQLLFETFNIHALYLGCGEVLSLYASGRTTGLSIGSGDGVTHTVSVYEVSYLSNAVRRMLYGGRDITARFAKLLSDRGDEMSTSAELEIVRDIKEKMGYIANDVDEEILKNDAMSHVGRSYEMPDGARLAIGTERFEAPELLFQPSLIETEELGIHDAMLSSIHKSDVDIQQDLAGNIVLAGGSTMFEGIVERLTRELGGSLNDVKVNAPAERKFSVWIGGSIWSSLSTFQTSWFTKDEYEDSGASLIHRKCF